MDTKFFAIPFAVSGDQAVVPDLTQTDGKVSYTQGYGPDYSLDPEADPDAILVERRFFNNLLFSITSSLGALQTDFPQWVSSSDNEGVPFGYNEGAVVRFTDGQLWSSTEDANVTVPGAIGAKWIVFGSQWALESALLAEVARAEGVEATLAPINSPVLTGTPKSPTFAPGTTGNLIATCSFVAGAVALETARAEAAEALLAPINSPFFTGIPQCVDPPPFGNPYYYIANMNQVTGAVANERTRAMAAEALLAPINSPALTGTPTTPTPPGNSSDGTIPNTAWVKSLLGTGGADPGTSLVFRYTYINVPIGGSYALAGFSWNQPFPSVCVGAIAGCHTNDVLNPPSAGNNMTAIAYGANNAPPDQNGGTVRVDTEQGRNVSGNIGVTVIGVGF